MSLRKVKYSPKSRALVNEYKMNRDWSIDFDDDKFKDVRHEIKEHYIKEQKYKCCYCQKEIGTGHQRYWDAEHVLCQSQYQPYIFEPLNLAVSCSECNSAKSDQQVTSMKRHKVFPRKSEDYVIVHPHFDEYDEHIAIILEIAYWPKTDKGDKTIEMCRLYTREIKRVGWAAKLSEAPALLKALNRVLEAPDEHREHVAMLELLAISQTRLSRSLLPSPTSEPETPIPERPTV